MLDGWMDIKKKDIFVQNKKVELVFTRKKKVATRFVAFKNYLKIWFQSLKQLKKECLELSEVPAIYINPAPKIF